jgi:hypothetical protein
MKFIPKKSTIDEKFHESSTLHGSQGEPWYK